MLYLKHIIFENMAHVGSFSYFVFIIVFSVFVFVIPCVSVIAFMGASVDNTYHEHSENVWLYGSVKHGRWTIGSIRTRS